MCCDDLYCSWWSNIEELRNDEVGRVGNGNDYLGQFRQFESSSWDWEIEKLGSE
jgi:hypothetical protein